MWLFGVIAVLTWLAFPFMVWYQLAGIADILDDIRREVKKEQAVGRVIDK